MGTTSTAKSTIAATVTVALLALTAPASAQDAADAQSITPDSRYSAVILPQFRGLHGGEHPKRVSRKTLAQVAYAIDDEGRELRLGVHLPKTKTRRMVTFEFRF